MRPAVRFVSSYPGTPSTEITESAAKYDEIYCEWAPNEKVAMEVGLRRVPGRQRGRFCAMKHVGLNVAADPLFTIAYTGVNAGMVICVADDPGMHSSQNEQDSRHYAVAAKVPMLEPADSAECQGLCQAGLSSCPSNSTPPSFCSSAPASPTPRASWNWASGVEPARAGPMRRTSPNTS